MKRFIVALFLFAACIACAGSTSSDRPWWRTDIKMRYDFPRKTWPSHVALRHSVSVRLYEKGVPVGSATLRRGLVLKLLNVQSDGTLEVSLAGFHFRVDHAATNFLEGLKTP